MSKLKTVETASAMINKILADRKREIEDLAELVEQDDEAIAKANEEMEAATASGNVKDYQAAKASRRDALDAKEMHESRLKTLNEKPLITKEEYEKTVAGILTEVAAQDDKTKQKLAILSDQMHAEGLALDKAIEEANETLKRLQHDVYRDADRSISEHSGEVIYLHAEDRAYNQRDTFYWATRGVSTPQYERYTGNRVQE